MASNAIFIYLLTLSLLLSISSFISDETIRVAAETLADAGFCYMSFTLPLVSQALLSSLPSATLFTPTDSSFSLLNPDSSFSLLKYHFRPQSYSFSDLQHHSNGSQISTLLSNQPLIITSTIFDDEFSINGVFINTYPVFDDGLFVIFEIDGLFNPNFTLEAPTVPSCANFTPGYAAYHRASSALRWRGGYSIMAAFLDLQLAQFANTIVDDRRARRLTVFAPSDAAIQEHIGNFSGISSVFLRHVVGCKITWGDLIKLDDEYPLSTYLKGFVINISGVIKTVNDHPRYTVILNGDVTVDFAEYYRNRRVVVHLINKVLAVPHKIDSKHREDHIWFRP